MCNIPRKRQPSPIDVIQSTSTYSTELLLSRILVEMKESFLFDGYVALSTKESQSLVLDMSSGKHYGSLILCDYHSGPNQQFKIAKADFGQVAFKLRSSGKALTVAEQSEENGARIVEEEFSGKPNQKFRMQEISPGTGEYVIYTFCGKALDVCEGKIKNESIVFQYAFNGESNQLWRVRPAK